jgi:uncharacterized membrane protein
MFQSGEWENRGFLFGPYCPIYGVAVMIAQFVFHSGVLPTDGDTNPLEIFLVCAIGSAIIEYITSYVLERKYHARWWDYSNIPLNINGRIAIPISCCFGLAGIVVVNYILPFFTSLGPRGDSWIYELVALGLMAIVATDLGMTLATLSSVVEKISSISDQFGDRIQWAYDRAGESKDELAMQLDNYAEYVKMRVQETAEHLGRKEIKIMHRMHYTRDEASFAARQLEKLAKIVRRDKSN